MDYINTTICDYITIDNIYNYFIDKDIIISDNDSFINKLKSFLLKYKRIIAIVFLIILLIIGYYCNYSYLEIKYNGNNGNNGNNKTYILKGGSNGIVAVTTTIKSPAPPKKASRQSQILKKASSSKAAQSISKGASKVKETLKSGKKDALKAGVSGIKNFGANRAEDFKDFSPWFYSIVYSVALTIMGFIIIMPALGFFVVGIICYVILKDKIEFIKSL